MGVAVGVWHLMLWTKSESANVELLALEDYILKFSSSSLASQGLAPIDDA